MKRFLQMFTQSDLGTKSSEEMMIRGERNVPVREYVDNIVRALVDHPEDVDVREIAGSRTTVFELRVAPGDLGKVIGKQGQTAKAIRTLLAAAAARQGKRAVLEILED